MQGYRIISAQALPSFGGILPDYGKTPKIPALPRRFASTGLCRLLYKGTIYSAWSTHYSEILPGVGEYKTVWK